MGRVRDTMRLEKDWRTIRVGYRAMFIDRPIESVSKLVGKETCPKDCRCEKKNAFTCIMRQSGCDMRSSDFYLVREAAYQSIIDKIYEGFTVDCEALRQVPNQIYITPQLSFQGTLDLKLQTQIQMGEEFMQQVRRRRRGVTRAVDFARLARRILGSVERAERIHPQSTRRRQCDDVGYSGALIL